MLEQSVYVVVPVHGVFIAVVVDGGGGGGKNHG